MLYPDITREKALQLKQGDEFIVRGKIVAKLFDESYRHVDNAFTRVFFRDGAVKTLALAFDDAKYKFD